MPTTAQKMLLFGGEKYANSLVSKYGASVVWPLVDMRSGTSILSTPVGYEGVATGFDLQNTPGPIPSEGSAPYLDGVNDYGNPYTAALASLFDDGEGAFMIWVKMGAGTLTDGNFHYFLQMRKSDSSNALNIYKTNTNNIVAVNWIGSSTSVTRTITVASYNWFQVFVRWSATENKIQAGVNGIQSGADLVYHAWNDVITSNYCGFGASLNGGSPGLIHNGWIAYYTLWAGTVPTIADFAAMYNEVTG